MDPLFGKKTEVSSCHISHLFVLNFGTINALLGMLWALRPASQGLYGFVLVLPLFQKEASHWPWSQKRKRCHGTTLTHRCFSFKPRASCCSWSQIAFSFFGLTARMRALLCMFVFPRASPHASVYVALSPFRIADKCRSLCLASLCMCTQWLGLQAVVQD